jgi:hypothetical protein
MRSFCRRSVLASLAVAAWLAGAPAGAASRYDPALRFRTLTTRHFHIHFHQGEERLAQRLAVVAEAVHADLCLRLQASPGGRTHVVLADQDDLANGFATTFPYNAIRIAVGPPGASTLLGNTDDWLKLVFAHEYAHILSLDRSESLAHALRVIFGRSPLAFPNGAQPLWEVEGLATFEETQVTGRGRIAAGDFGSLVAEPARTGRLEPLDRANGGLVPWPSGDTPYAYGGFFFRYLALRYGEASIAQLSRTTGRGYYFLPSVAFRKVYHASLSEAWRDFERTFAVPPSDGVDEATRLTFQGFQVVGPRFVPAGMAITVRHGRATAPSLLYSVQNADDYPSLMVVPADGSGRPRPVVDRFGGASVSSDGRTLIFDKLELDRSVALKSDLYRLDPAGRRVVRMTHGARLVAPDVSPDGSLLACIRLVDGMRTLAVFSLAALERAGPRRLPDPVFALAEPGVQYDSPRWSPDGRRIAAVRWKLGGPSELIVLDIATRRAAVLTSARSGRDVSPVFCPDGRTILFASDREGGEFALYAAEEPDGAAADRLAPVLYRVARVRGGAMSPDVSPDGHLIAFVGYTTAGYDLFTMPLDRSRWTRLTPDGPAAAAAADAPASTGTAAAATPAPRASGYSPFGMLVPRYWLPDLRTEDGFLKAGVSTTSADVLGRHSVAASVVWRVAGESGDEHLGGRPDWSAVYVYDRWRPAFFVSGSDETSFLAVVSQPGAPPSADAELRELTAEAGVRLPFLTVQHAQLWQLSLAADRNTLETADLSVARNRNAFRVAWAFNSAKTYGFSISAEQGVSIGATAELARRALGAAGDANAYTIEMRAYPRLGGRHAVLALRAGAGTTSGDRSVRRTFFLGGSDPAGSLIDFGSGGLSMLRGFSSLSFAGYNTAVANIDYRRPLLRLDRGVSWLPVMARVVHGAVFVDAGNVWSRGFSINDTKVSVGGEASFDLVVGYSLPLALSAGAAWTRNGRDSTFGGPTFYFRLGRAF